MFGDHPRIIYVKILRRAKFYPPSTKIGKLCAIRARFNEILNTAVARCDQHIMNVATCSVEENFDQWGNLSECGKKAFWQ